MSYGEYTTTREKREEGMEDFRMRDYFSLASDGVNE
jgi:hypothetical protein